MIEASVDLSATELELSDVTSPLLASRVITSEEEQGSSRKKKIKPTKSINDLLKFESESGSEAEEEEEVFPPDSDPDPQPEQVVYTPNLEMLHSSLEKEMDCGGGSQPGDGDSLSLEEIGHIRRAHVKAYIESLPEEGPVKKDLQKSKICFQCLKTKFGLFSRARRCEVCRQSVCGRCCSRVSATPLLTPGHAPSPAPGKLVLICHDCKEMVLQIIRPGEVAKNQARRLMLAQFARREEGNSL